MPAVNHRFSSCVFIVNPSAARYNYGKTYAAQLAAYFKPATITRYTLTDQDFQNPERIQQHLQQLTSQSLLVIHGGDGTINMVLNQLIQLDARSAKQATILPLWGGNACDLATIINGRPMPTIGNILQNGQATAVYPLQYELRAAQLVEVHAAICYLSFGAVAYTAQQLNVSALIARTKKWRTARFICEMLISMISLQRAKRFRIKQAAKTERVYDLLYLNGSRLAKTYRLPAKLSQPQFVAMKVGHKYPILLSHLSSLSYAWAHGCFATEQTFSLASDIWMQYDGEVKLVNSGTTVKVTTVPEPLQLLATKPI